MLEMDHACDLARQRVSSELDGELSEFDRHLLARHLERCVECRRFADDALTLTQVLRTAPLDPYTCGEVGPRRARRFGRARQIAPVAAAILVVSTAATTLVTGGRREQPRLMPITAHRPIATKAGFVADRVKLPIGQRSAGDDF
jgi:predicted anti-sigma-YlaC factor YlaD